MSLRHCATFLTSILAVGSAATLVACGTPPANLDLGLRHASEQQRFMVDLEPPTTPMPIGQIHAWKVRLATRDGMAVSHARVAIDGGMPQHGHGLPTRPRVTGEVAPGTYVVEGMKFSMSGWWTLRVDIDAAGAQDRAVFNIVLDDAGAQRRE